MQFNFPKAEWNPKLFDRFQKSISDAVSKFDFDSNERNEGLWESTPVSKTVEHNLGVLPKTVVVYSADNQDGGGMTFDTWWDCTSTQLTINGAKAYYRVLLNK